MKKRIIAIMLTVATVLTFTACGNKGNQETAQMITDREGKSVQIPQKIEKIVSMAPSFTETLVNLGLGDKIVGIDSNSTYVEGIPQDVAVYDMLQPDTESIISLSPDVVFVSGVSESEMYKTLSDLGVFVTYIETSTNISAIKEDIKYIGEITRENEKATEIITNMEQEIDKIITKIGDNANNKEVYFEIAPSPGAYSFGRNTFLNEIIEMLGAKNILADQESWVSVSEEEIVNKNPDVIFTNVNYIDNPVDEILNRNGWDKITAVKNKAVYQISNNESSQPNENITIAMKEIATALYPELFN